jgi:hypothetical protein
MSNDKIETLLGRTLSSVVNDKNEEIVFTTTEGGVYKLLHFQSCCEHVRVEEIIGDLDDLVDAPILQAEEISNETAPPPEYADSYTWTFYKLATIKGSVTLRWLGESNGYYSEAVDFITVRHAALRAAAITGA